MDWREYERLCERGYKYQADLMFDDWVNSGGRSSKRKRVTSAFWIMFPTVVLIASFFGFLVLLHG